MTGQRAGGCPPFPGAAGVSGGECAPALRGCSHSDACPWGFTTTLAGMPELITQQFWEQNPPRLGSAAWHVPPPSLLPLPPGHPGVAAAAPRARVGTPLALCRAPPAPACSRPRLPTARRPRALPGPRQPRSQPRRPEAAGEGQPFPTATAGRAARGSAIPASPQPSMPPAEPGDPGGPVSRLHAAESVRPSQPSPGVQQAPSREIQLWPPALPGGGDTLPGALPGTDPWGRWCPQCPEHPQWGCGSRASGRGGTGSAKTPCQHCGRCEQALPSPRSPPCPACPPAPPAEARGEV